MICRLLLLSMLAVSALSKKYIPLEGLFQIVVDYPEVSFCNRTCVSDYWMDIEAGNVRHITYTGQLKSGETYWELCDCMNEHMTQRDWLRGAYIVCYVNYGSVTYEVIGKPDPTFNPNAKSDKKLDRPLEKLKVIFENTPTTDPVGLKCEAKCIEKANIIYCWLNCQQDSRTAEECCTAIKNYYNQKGWLQGASINCGENNDRLVVSFVGTA